MARYIAIAPPSFILGRPPASKRVAAGQIIRIDHPSMIEGPLVIAPSAFRILGRTEVATRLADSLHAVRGLRHWLRTRIAGIELDIFRAWNWL
jgi:hypothetical protein